MDGIPLPSEPALSASAAATLSDPDIEEDQLDPSSPPPPATNHPEDPFDDEVPRFSSLISDDESLPELNQPSKPKNKKPTQPKPTKDRPVRKAAARSKVNPPPSGSQTAVQMDKPRPPKRDATGKAKVTATKHRNPPDSPLSSEVEHVDPPGPKAKRKRKSSKGKTKAKVSAAAEEQDDDAAESVKPPTTVIAHVEIRPAAAPLPNRSRRTSKANSQPENHRLSSISFPSNATYSEVRQKLAECAQVLPVFISNDITWKFTTPASAPAQPLNNPVSMEALRRQVEDREAKGKDHVLLLVMGPTLSTPTMMTTDSSILDAAKMVSDHYPKGRCTEHPDIACAKWENLHFELNEVRCKVWGNKILMGTTTVDRPPVGSAHFKTTDVIKRKPPVPSQEAPKPPSTPSSVSAELAMPNAGPSSFPMVGIPQHLTTPFPPAFSPFGHAYPPHMTMPYLGYHHPLFLSLPFASPLNIPSAPQMQVYPPAPPANFSANPPSSPPGPSCTLDQFCDAANLQSEDRRRLQDMDFRPGQKVSKIPKEVWSDAGIKPLTLSRILDTDRRRKRGEIN
ncbi:hypothetical protein FRB90_005776 [Tulasnella sp. 427]|nr:hypothetical protein FRB90_005776 [Tulasnella sp. 427]